MNIEELASSFSQDISPILLPLLTSVRDANRAMFEEVEGKDFINAKRWEKAGPSDLSQGGGIMCVGRGEILEKCAVNMSVVRGEKYPTIENEHAEKPFVAAGVSLICHPKNPHAPIAHMNVRCIQVGIGKDKKTWIGGGADLTPMVKYEEDTNEFHTAMKVACDKHRPGEYEKLKAWCDEYFYIPHRKETRGVGGIFFDYIDIENEKDYQFLSDVGKNFAQAYGKILKKRVGVDFDDALKEKHLYWRGRYAEFNLAYDRGTRFGLLTGGNIEAIFASLPPIVKW